MLKADRQTVAKALKALDLTHKLKQIRCARANANELTIWFQDGTSVTWSPADEQGRQETRPVRPIRNTKEQIK